MHIMSALLCWYCSECSFLALLCVLYFFLVNTHLNISCASQLANPEIGGYSNSIVDTTWATQSNGGTSLWAHGSHIYLFIFTLWPCWDFLCESYLLHAAILFIYFFKKSYSVFVIENNSPVSSLLWSIQ